MYICSTSLFKTGNLAFSNTQGYLLFFTHVAVQEERGPRKGASKSSASAVEYSVIHPDQRRKYPIESISLDSNFPTNFHPGKIGCTQRSEYTKFTEVQLHSNLQRRADKEANWPNLLTNTRETPLNYIWPLPSNNSSLNFSQPALYWEQVNGVQG
jgi:hypothetical protein